MSGIIGMAGGITAKIGGIVTGAGAGRAVHIEFAVPMIAQGIGGFIEKLVIGGRVQFAGESARPGTGDFNPMTGGALIMAGQRHRAVIDRSSPDPRFGSTIRGKAVAGGAVEAEFAGFGMTTLAAAPNSTYPIQSGAMA